MNPARGAHRIPRLMLVTDRRRSVLPLPALVEAAIAGGCDAIQVREKDLSVGERRELVRLVRAAVRGEATVLINDDVELAAAEGIGVHLPEAGTVPKSARLRLGRDALIGRSVHSANEAADSTGADYLIAGNVFPTDSHPGRAGLGIEGFTAIVASTSLPVLAIGGVHAGNLDEVIRAGAHGIAVVSAIAMGTDQQDIFERTVTIHRALADAIRQRSGV